MHRRPGGPGRPRSHPPTRIGEADKVLRAALGARTIASRATPAPISSLAPVRRRAALFPTRAAAARRGRVWRV